MKILVVDDDESLRANLSRLLRLEDHEVSTAKDGNEALAQVREWLPDLIFTDVHMPGLDGYELCKVVKAHADTRAIPVIFVSGEESIEGRLLGFAAGGEDFIVKPFQVQEVLAKVGSATRIAAESRALKAQADSAQSAAFVAMQWAAEIGLVLDFVRRSLAATAQSELALLVRDTAAQFGVDAAVMIRGERSTCCLSSRGRDIPLDLSVMSHVRLQGRIFEFQNRSAFNYDSVTVVVSDMPRDDPERCGRLRDHFALLAEAADARNRALELEAAKLAQTAGVSAALAATETAVRKLTVAQRANQERLSESIGVFKQNLTRVFVGCGLKESQEASIFAVVDDYTDLTAELLDAGRHSVDEMDRIGGLLARLAPEAKR